MSEPDIIFVDDLACELPEDKAMLAFQRAEREFDNCVVDYQGDLFVEAYAEQLRLVVVNDMIHELLQQGILEVDRIADDGALVYKRGPNFPED